MVVTDSEELRKLIFRRNSQLGLLDSIVSISKKLVQQTSLYKEAMERDEKLEAKNAIFREIDQLKRRIAGLREKFNADN